MINRHTRSKINCRHTYRKINGWHTFIGKMVEVNLTWKADTITEEKDDRLVWSKWNGTEETAALYGHAVILNTRLVLINKSHKEAIYTRIPGNNAHKQPQNVVIV